MSRAEAQRASPGSSSYSCSHFTAEMTAPKSRPRQAPTDDEKRNPCRFASSWRAVRDCGPRENLSQEAALLSAAAAIGDEAAQAKRQGQEGQRTAHLVDIFWVYRDRALQWAAALALSSMSQPCPLCVLATLGDACTALQINGAVRAHRSPQTDESDPVHLRPLVRDANWRAIDVGVERLPRGILLRRASRGVWPQGADERAAILLVCSRKRVCACDPRVAAS